jgi:hypothetical protein
LNCKPSFVVTKQRTACCNLAFCPFRSARWVYEVWVNIEHDFFAEVPSRGRSPRDLIYRSATKPVPAQVPGQDGNTCDGLAVYLGQRIRLRNRTDAQLGARGRG